MRYFVLKPVEIADGWMEALCRDVPTEEAFGMITAEDVVCACDVPNYTFALRDGWAVSTLQNGSPRHPAAWRVENGAVKGEALRRDEAVWVNTGGAIPAGADAVIADTMTGNENLINEQPKPGENISRCGSDWLCGDLILPSGSRVGVREMALLYEAGVKQVSGWVPPRVAIVATGNELTEKAEGLMPGFRRSSNASYIEALLLRSGIREVRTVVVSDDPKALADTLRKLDSESDVIVTVGGTGRGCRDYMRQAVLAGGGRFISRDSQTDYPFIAARLSHAGLIGLPGNPLAVIMIVQCIFIQILRRVFRLPAVPQETVSAILKADIPEGSVGELCVSLDRSENEGELPFAMPVLKGTGRMRIFEGACGWVHLSRKARKSGDRVKVHLFLN